jgi:hypothetical protein
VGNPSVVSAIGVPSRGQKREPGGNSRLQVGQCIDVRTSWFADSLDLEEERGNESPDSSSVQLYNVIFSMF